MSLARRKKDNFYVAPPKIYLTKDGLEKLKSELARLKANLPHYREETARTAAYGDRSENAEYKDAKGRLRRSNYRILEIEEQLKRVEIITAGVGFGGSAQLGSRVTLLIRGEKKTFQIVGPSETNPTQGRISHVSPIGAALMHKQKGDIVRVKTLKGEEEYEILDVQ